MRDTNSQITFTDLEFMRQGIQMNPELEQILEFVQQNHALVEAVRQQLDHGLKKPQTGRPGPVETDAGADAATDDPVADSHALQKLGLS